MLTPEEHTKLLRSFEVDRLLKLVTVEAKRLRDGHLAVFSFISSRATKSRFGDRPELYPGNGGTGYFQPHALPGYPHTQGGPHCGARDRQGFLRLL